MSRLSALRALRRNRPLSFLIGVGAVSSFGDWLYLAALPIVVYQQTHDAALVGLAAAGRLLPFFLLSIPAGVAADRFDRRRILLAAETTRCICMLAMAALSVVDGGVALLLALATMSAAAGTFAIPAQHALIPVLATDTDELGLANACSATLDNVACIAGPIVAGLLVVTAGLGVACAINGLTFALVVAILATIRSIPVGTRTAADGGAATTSPTTTAVAIPAERRLIGLFPTIRAAAGPITLDAAISFGSGALGVLPVLIAVEWLRAGEAFSGVLGAAGGLGAVAGGIAAGMVVNGDQRRGTVVGVAVAAASLGLLGFAPIATVAVAASAVAVGALVLLDTLNITNLQRSLPAAALGRGFGILNTSAAVWLIAGSSIPPVVAAVVGIQAGVLVTAVVVATLGAA